MPDPRSISPSPQAAPRSIDRELLRRVQRTLAAARARGTAAERGVASDRPDLAKGTDPVR